MKAWHESQWWGLIFVAVGLGIMFFPDVIGTPVPVGERYSVAATFTAGGTILWFLHRR